MINLPPFKRGDTWSLTCTYKREGNPIDITNIDIFSQIKDSKYSLITDLIVTKADQGKSRGTFVLTPVDPITDKWTLGSLLCDIEFVSGGIKLSTETFALPVVEQVTQVGV